MNILILISNRLIKLFANISKILCYIFHYLFPQKRFTIPKYSSATFPSKKKPKINKIIWQTNYTNSVSLPVYLNYLFNRLMSLTYEYRYMSHKERLNFINSYATKEVATAFTKLNEGAAQADLWRLFVLYHYGGVYLDIDAHLVWPIANIIQPDFSELIMFNKQHYTNYFLASEKNNPTIKKAINLVVNNINNKKIQGGVYALTGPSALNKALENEKFNTRFYRYTCIQGSFTNEYFQYIDKVRGKWTYKKPEQLLKS